MPSFQRNTISLMDVSTLLDGLNKAQRDAVSAPASNLLVLAGAGSGKTRVLVHRIAWLVQVENYSPHSIMAVTFTNRAAAEMRGRIETMLNLPARSLWIGTFHGLAHRLLKTHWKEAKLPQNFQIIDSDDQLRLIKRVMKELAIDEKSFLPKQVQHFINASKDEGKRANHVDAFDYYQKTMQRIYLAYEQMCQRGGLVDFAEILLRSHEIWLNNPDILQHYQQRFQHILVDEFQDTNTIQYAWLRVLAGNSSYMMAVGDDDQSIYGWRGARIENIQRFTEDFASTQTVRLEQNYRSTGVILQAANAVIDNNPSRLGKKLWTDGEQGELIDVYAAFNEYDEARYVVERIQELIRKEHCNKSDVAILYRSNVQSRVLEEAFIRSGVAYRIYGGQRFYERLEIKHALAYMKLVANYHDDAAFDRVVNVPTRGIGNKTIDDLREIARDHGCSLWNAVDTAVEHSLLTPRARTALQAFQQLIGEMQEQTAALTLDELSDQIIKLSGLKAHFAKEKGEVARSRLENLDELINATGQYVNEEESETTVLQQFLSDVALDAGDNQAEEGDDCVQLMTMHSAKGLEFRFVFIVGVEENIFPSRMSSDTVEGLEEERRLCYVGITRAMQQLFLSYAEARRLYGEEVHNPPSRFLAECPQELLREVRIQTQISRPVSARPMRSSVQHTQIQGFNLGQRVQHSVFGEGIILHIEGQGDNGRVQVNFDGAGSKWLVLQYANLEAL